MRWTRWACGLRRAIRSQSWVSNKYGVAGRGFNIMQGKRGHGERRLEEALADFASALAQADLTWMVIGGIAVIARGVRRMTSDIDAVVRGDQTNVGALLRILAGWQIVPRIGDAEAFARENLVLLLRHDPTGVEFDVSMAWTAFEHEALEARSDTKYGGVVVPMARAQDLVVFKAMAARPRDIEDAAALLMMHRDIDLDRVRLHLGQLAALADEPSLASGLEAVIKLFHSASKKRDSTRARRAAPALMSKKALPAGKSKLAAQKKQKKVKTRTRRNARKVR